MSGRLIPSAFVFLLVVITISYQPRWWSELHKQWSTISGQLSSEPTLEDWNLFRHLGGNGPWIPRAVDDSDSCSVPINCSVTQAHMVCLNFWWLTGTTLIKRARFHVTPSDIPHSMLENVSRKSTAYLSQLRHVGHVALFEKLHRADVELSGSLAFVKSWSYFTDLNNPRFENLTSTGPYAGTLQAYDTGKKLRGRYDHLVPNNRSVNFWTCDSPRDIETARNFADGFFGHDWQLRAMAKLHIIPESEDRGADTLTPGRSCRNYRSDQESGRANGYIKLAQFQTFMAREISPRLSHDAGGLSFTPLEVYGMMELCGFEILVRGSSPWCKVFTQDEWMHYEYARDLLHFYRSGPGNPYAGALGWLWLNATKQQLVNDSATGVYHSFVHDGDIVPLLATMGLFDEDGGVQVLPADRRKDNRHWKTSDVVPMGGRIILERVDCVSADARSEKVERFVRLEVNDGPFNLKHLIGESKLPCGASLDRFKQWADKKGEDFGSFRDICGIGDEVPERITFLHQ